MAKNIEDGFKTFIGRLAPLTSEHDKAKTHRESVRGSMIKNFQCYDFFETGSFGNGTGVRHYSDTDYFAVCPSKELWTSSSYTLKIVKEALQTTFRRTTGISVSTPAVQIPFGQYASENLEVTPCTFNGLVDTPIGKKSSYDISDFAGGWMKASPQAHNAYVKRENDRLGGKLKPLIQLVKAWKFNNNVPITSFYLELRITKYAEKETVIVYDIDLKNIINHLVDINLASIVDPMGISGYVSACSTEAKKIDSLSKLNTGLSRSLKAVEHRENDLDKAFYWWNMFYNYNFPNR